MAGIEEHTQKPAPDVDIVIVGAGVLGLYQLYVARQAGYSVQVIEKGGGVGGTWYWNRYPGCRFDSESYTYGYLFSEELWQEWDWSEEFAGQPETERYLNHMVDKFDLRQFIRFRSTVDSATWDEATHTWAVGTEDGHRVTTRFLINTTGVLSIPQYPEVAGREDFQGQAYHPARWPSEPVEFTGKRVAIIGSGSSGVQIAPEIADEVASLTLYQRTPTWCTPLNNHPIDAEQQAYLKANFEEIRDQLNGSIAGFLHVGTDKKTFDDSKEERRAFYEKVWNSPGFAKLTVNYSDMMFSKEANSEWCAFLEEKIRGIVNDPATADKLIPKDHLYAGLRPPFVTGYYEMFNKDIDLEFVSLRENPFVKVTETGIETADGHRDFDIIIWATGFDFGTGAMLRMGIVGDGISLQERWFDGPQTYLGIMSHKFPNMFFPGGPHGAAGNNPRYGADQIDFVQNLLDFARDNGHTRIEVPHEREDEWMNMIDEMRAYSTFQERGQYYGGNTPGKPKRYLLNPGGKPKLVEAMNKAITTDYEGFLSA